MSTANTRTPVAGSVRGQAGRQGHPTDRYVAACRNQRDPANRRGPVRRVPRRSSAPLKPTSRHGLRGNPPRAATLPPRVEHRSQCLDGTSSARARCHSLHVGDVPVPPNPTTIKVWPTATGSTDSRDNAPAESLAPGAPTTAARQRLMGERSPKPDTINSPCISLNRAPVSGAGSIRRAGAPRSNPPAADSPRRAEETRVSRWEVAGELQAWELRTSAGDLAIIGMQHHPAPTAVSRGSFPRYRLPSKYRPSQPFTGWSGRRRLETCDRSPGAESHTRGPAPRAHSRARAGVPHPILRGGAA